MAYDRHCTRLVLPSLRYYTCERDRQTDKYVEKWKNRATMSIVAVLLHRALPVLCCKESTASSSCLLPYLCPCLLYDVHLSLIYQREKDRGRGRGERVKVDYNIHTPFPHLLQLALQEKLMLAQLRSKEEHMSSNGVPPNSQ